MVVPPPPPPVMYTLAPSGPLPRIDTVKSIKHVLLSPQHLSQFNRFLRQQRVKITVCYWLGVTLGTCVLFSPPTCGVPLAIFSMPLQLLPSIVSVMALRFDMVRLVMKGYEFWFMTLSNLAVCVLIWFSFNDMRGLIMIGASSAFQTALLLDANHRASRLVSVATVFGALTNIIYVVCATFGVIEYGRDLELLRYNNRVLYADDAVANLIATLVLLLVRNGVRRYREPPTNRIVSCITYRCRVVLVSATQTPLARSPPRESSSTSQGKTHPPPRSFSHLTQMLFIDDACTFASDNTLFPPHWLQRSGLLLSSLTQKYRFVSLGVRLCQGWILCFVSYLSLLGWVLAALSKSKFLVQLTAALAAFGAGLVFFTYAAFSQRELLLRLVTSFDVVFLSVQLTITHACLADIVGWTQSRALAVLASWLWMHWVLLLDSVLPLHKHTRLGFQRHVAVAVIVLFVAEQLLVALVIVLHDQSTQATPSDLRLDLRDNEIFTLTFHSRLKQLRVVPLFFGRLLSTLSWSLRLLWRIWKSTHLHGRDVEEMLMLQGRVQYEPLSSTGSTSMVWFAAGADPRVFPLPGM